MKTTITIIFISLILVGCSKQSINLDEKVQKELSEIELLCQKTNVVSALLIIKENLKNKILQGKFICPNYAYYAIFEIISNSYNEAELENELSNTNNIASLLAESYFYMLANEPEKKVEKAYQAYKKSPDRIDALQQTLEVMIDYDNKLDEKAQLLLNEFNFKSTNELSKLYLNFQYNVNRKKFDDSLNILNQIRQKHPNFELICDLDTLTFLLYAKIHSKDYKTESNSRKIFNLFLKLYKNGYKDIWFGMTLGKEALKQEKYKLAVEGFEMCIDLSKKYDMTFYSDNLLAFYGFALQKCGKTKEARKVLNEALELNPTNEYAISFLKKLE